MAITSYQIDSVIKAYQKHNRVRPRIAGANSEDMRSPVRSDVVSISGKPEVRAEAYEKISYSLKDILVNGVR
ncbi:MAG: hypothetical protein PHD57_08630 [Desulfobacterales bacterium]|nr:hypothetical protein [Desulfobacterales bacterium]MDD3081506.1 hypothetical protein [Desulfobacterales bacterium]MDD3950999.1 hypothetical protein [Desulfobacterales bacterium]MDD4464453.1 hypothetical protein [Desulfobacterales bacterium]